jgi:hypothetical protein
LCRRVNEVLSSNIAADKFVTLFYGILDSRARTLQYSNAGHLPPLLVRSNGSSEKLSEGGAVLGVFPEGDYADALVHLRPGDRLLLFTDGITEAADLNSEEYGEVGLLRAAQAAVALSPTDLKAHLLTDVNRFCNSHLHDDVTLTVGLCAGIALRSLGLCRPGRARGCTESRLLMIADCVVEVVATVLSLVAVPHFAIHSWLAQDIRGASSCDFVFSCL